MEKKLLATRKEAKQIREQIAVSTMTVEIPTTDQQIMQYTKAKYKIYFYNKLAEA